VYVAVATSTCEDDGHCGCKGLWSDKGGSTCVLPPEIGKRLPTHSPSAFLKPPFQARTPYPSRPRASHPPRRGCAGGALRTGQEEAASSVRPCWEALRMA